MPATTSKKKTPKKRSKKGDKKRTEAERKQIIEKVVPLLFEGNSYRDMCSVIMRDHKMSRRNAGRYIGYAYEAIKADLNLNIENVVNQQFLRMEMLWQTALDERDFKEARAVLDMMNRAFGMYNHTAIKQDNETVTLLPEEQIKKITQLVDKHVV